MSPEDPALHKKRRKDKVSPKQTEVVSSRVDLQASPNPLLVTPSGAIDESGGVYEQAASAKKAEKEARKALKTKVREEKEAIKALAEQNSSKLHPDSEDIRSSTEKQEDTKRNKKRKHKPSPEELERDDKRNESGIRPTKKQKAGSPTEGEDAVDPTEEKPKVAKRKTRAEAREAKLKVSLQAQKEHQGSVLSYIKAYEASKSDKNTPWKFNKAKQNWLIRHLWDKEAIPESAFDGVLSYLTGLQGGSKEALVKSCQDILSAPPMAAPNTTVNPPSSEAAGSIDNRDVGGKPKSILKSTQAKPPTPDEIDSRRIKEERAKCILAALETK